MANVEINVSNKIVDSNFRTHNSIRQLAKEIHVKRERISKSLNERGVFVHNGVTYMLYKDAVKGTVANTSTGASFIPSPTKAVFF